MEKRMTTDPLQYFIETILPCSARMYAAALAITCSKEDASDAVQTAMLRIWEHVRVGMILEHPANYCLSVIKNICITEVVRNRKCIPIDNLMEIKSDIDSPADKAMELKDVTHAMNHLSENERRAIELNAFAGCSTEQIGLALGTNATNARKILSRGRIRLRSFFEKKG